MLRSCAHESRWALLGLALACGQRGDSDPSEAQLAPPDTDENPPAPVSDAKAPFEPREAPPPCNAALCCPPGVPVIEGDEGPNNLVGGSASQCLVGLGGDDTLEAGSAGDYLFAGAGADACTGNSASDTIVGGTGDDQIDAGSGNDTIDAGAGNDTVLAGSGNDVVRGGDGADNINAGSDSDQVDAGRGNDTISGETGNDTLNGDQGDDTVAGGSGSDRIRGGAGVDTLRGDSGNDAFVIGAECEVSAGETVDGGSGIDKVESPYTKAQLQQMGVTFISVEQFVITPTLSDSCVTVVKPWAGSPIRPSADELVVAVAPRDDDKVLAATGNTVYEIDAVGNFVQLATGDRAVLSAAGDSFGILSGSSFSVFDAGGVLRSTHLNVPVGSYFLLAPGTGRVFAPVVISHGPHDFSVDEAQVFDLDGVLQAAFPTASLEYSRVTPGHVVFYGPSQLTKVGLDGAVAWSTNVEIHRVEPSHGAQTRLVATPRFTLNTVLHSTEDQAFFSTVVDGTVWNIAIAPGKVYSAATTHPRPGNKPPWLYVFQDGGVSSAQELALAYANSLGVSDNGEVVLGGQRSDGTSQVSLYNKSGTALFDDVGPHERNGGRPGVRFLALDRFASITSSGLTAYDIHRNP